MADAAAAEQSSGFLQMAVVINIVPLLRGVTVTCVCEALSE